MSNRLPFGKWRSRNSLQACFHRSSQSSRSVTRRALLATSLRSPSIHSHCPLALLFGEQDELVLHVCRQAASAPPTEAALPGVASSVIAASWVSHVQSALRRLPLFLGSSSTLPKLLNALTSTFIDAVEQQPPQQPSLIADPACSVVCVGAHFAFLWPWTRHPLFTLLSCDCPAGAAYEHLRALSVLLELLQAPPGKEPEPNPELQAQSQAQPHQTFAASTTAQPHLVPLLFSLLSKLLSLRVSEPAAADAASVGTADSRMDLDSDRPLSLLSDPLSTLATSSASSSTSTGVVVANVVPATLPVGSFCAFFLSAWSRRVVRSCSCVRFPT